jgi:hypothetical protein
MLRWSHQVIQADFMRWRKNEQQLLPDETKRYKARSRHPYDLIRRERPGLHHLISEARSQH